MTQSILTATAAGRAPRKPAVPDKSPSALRTILTATAARRAPRKPAVPTRVRARCARRER